MIQNYKNTWTYHGIVELPIFKGYIFNHGTESKINDRTRQHKSDCANETLVYKVIYEKDDRLFGSDVISKSTDKEYVTRVANRLNETVLDQSNTKAMLLRDWFNTLGVLKSTERGFFDALRKSNLSETECIFIPDCITEAQLQEAIDYVNKTWFFKEKKLLVSAIPYKNKTAKQKKMAAKPIPKAFYQFITALVKNCEVIRVQSIELAYLLICLLPTKSIKKLRVIITADDKEVHDDTYKILKQKSYVELIECESDADMVEEYKEMTEKIQPDLDIMNPPYDGALHLDILKTVLETKKPGSTAVSIQPCGWLENQLTAYKNNKEYQEYLKSNIVSELSDLQIIDLLTAQRLFNIGTDVDLGIYIYEPDKTGFDINSIRLPEANSVFAKVMAKLPQMQTLNDVLEEGKVDGWRVKLNELRPQSGGTNPEANGYSHKTWGVQLISSTEAGISECVFKDGYNDNGIYWTDTRSKNQFGKNNGTAFRHSIKTNDKQTALNIAESCNTEFYRNLIHLYKFDQHMPLRFLPYMGDYSHVWTNEDYCKYFGLDQKETIFMSRHVEDFRTKDFINYIDLNAD